MKNIISIVLPVYNSEKTIEQTIESILNQKFKSYELIIVNDGSTDNTRDICEKYLKRENVKIINISNSGPSNARNVGISKCSGKYLMFIDADDTYSEDMLEKMYKYMHSNKCDIVCCNYTNLNKDKITLNEKIQEKLYNKDELFYCIEYMVDKKIFNVVWNKIYKTDIIKENGIFFNKNIELGEDYCFNLDYFEKINCAKIINEYLYNYRILSNSICTKYRENIFELKYSNVKYHENMYLRKGFNVNNLANKYIDCFKSSVISLISNNTITYNYKINKIKQYMNIIYSEVKKRSNYNLTRENSLILNLISKNMTKCVYLFLYFRTLVKKISCFIKMKQFR